MSDKENDNSWLAWLVIGGLMLSCMLGGKSSSGRTDGVFESATQKLDSGRPLNDRERQRIDDILNWCKKCNGPYRNCNH